MVNVVALSLALLLVVGWEASAGAQAVTPPPAPQEPSAGAVAGATAVNVFRIPGKTLLCGLTVATTTGLMLMTFGTQYRPIAAVFREGCGGKWVIGPDDLNRNVDPPKAIFSPDR